MQALMIIPWDLFLAKKSGGYTRFSWNKQKETHQTLKESLDENRIEAQQMTKAFNKRVRVQSFQKANLVLAIWTPLIIDKKKGKLEPNWEGPFMVEKVYSNGTYLLVTMEGDRIILPINAPFLKKYYPRKDLALTKFWASDIRPHKAQIQKIKLSN